MARWLLRRGARGEGPEDRRRKGRRWLFFFAVEKGEGKIKAWTNALRKSVEDGCVDIKIEERRSSAILAWPEPGVCWYSAYRIGMKAKKDHDRTFKLMPKFPRCVDTVADTAGPNAGTPEPEAAAAPRKRKLVGKTPAEAAKKKLGTRPAGEEKAAESAGLGVPPHWLLLKLEQQFCHLLNLGTSKYEEDKNPYKVWWETRLGEGTYGVVFPGSLQHQRTASAASANLAIKICRDQNSGVEQEVRRCMTCAGVPQLVRLLDIQVFVKRPGLRPCLGMVFPKFSSDLWQCFHAGLQWREPGIRHIVSSVLEALKHMHAHGLVHSDLKPGNILLRSRPLFAEHWNALIASPKVHSEASALPPEVKYQLPAFFEVRSAPLEEMNAFLSSLACYGGSPNPVRHATRRG